MITGQVQQPFWEGHGDWSSDSTEMTIEVTSLGKPAEVGGHLEETVEEGNDEYRFWS